MTQTNANDVLMGGGGAPSAKFDEPGTEWAGPIVSPPETHQVRKYDPNNPGGGELRFFPSGDPIMGITVDIQTTVRDSTIDEDDGVRRIYIDGRYLKDAVRDAVRKAGASGLEVGGQLRVKFTHREDPTDKRSRKFWDVTYTAPGNAALMADAAPAPVAPPTPAPAPAAQVSPAPVPAPAPAAAGPTPQDIQTAKTLIAAGLTDDVIRTSAPSLTPEVIQALRNAA